MLTSGGKTTESDEIILNHSYQFFSESPDTLTSSEGLHQKLTENWIDFELFLDSRQSWRIHNLF